MSALSGFAAGLAQGFGEGVSAGAKIQEIRGKRRYRDKDGSGIPDPFDGGGGGVPEKVPSTDTDTDTTESTTTASTGTMPNRGGEDFNKYIYNYYRSKGLSHPHAAGIVANIDIESGGGDPRVISGVRRGDNGSAWYLGQWRGSRKTNIESFAGGKPSLQQQLDFYLEEGNPKSKYSEAGAVKAHRLAANAKTPEEATQYIMQFYERPSSDPNKNHIAKRIQTAKSLSDEYTGEVGTLGFDFGAAGTAGAEERNTPGYEETSVGGGGQEAGDSGGGGEEEVAWEIPEAVIPEITDWTEFAKMAQYQVPEQQEVYAAEGGVIPEPRQRYAEGGKVDPYNPARDYTQAAPATTARTWTPRRVGDPGTTTTASTSGGTSSQLALRQAQAGLTATRAADAAAVKPAEEVAKPKLSANQQWNRDQEKKYGAYQGENWRDAKKRYNQKLYYDNVGRRAGAESGYGSGSGGNWFQGGIVGGYARGGVVTVDPDYWQTALKRAGVRGEPTQEQRDMVARRVNKEKGGGNSTAIKIGKSGPKGETAKQVSVKRTAEKKGGGGGGGKSVPIPTPAPRGDQEPKIKVAAVAPQSVTKKKPGEPEEPKIKVAAVAPTSATKAKPDLPGDIAEEYVRPAPHEPTGIPEDQQRPKAGAKPLPHPVSKPVIKTEADDFDITRDPWETLLGGDEESEPAAPAEPGKGPVRMPDADRDWYRRNDPAISQPVQSQPHPRSFPAGVKPGHEPTGIPREQQTPEQRRDRTVEIKRSQPQYLEQDGKSFELKDDGIYREVGAALQGRPAIPESPVDVPEPQMQLPAEPPQEFAPQYMGSNKLPILNIDGVLMERQEDGSLIPYVPMRPLEVQQFAYGGSVLPEEDDATPLGGRRPEQYAPQAAGPRPQIVDPSTGARSPSIPPREQRPGVQDIAQEGEPEKEDVRPTKRLMDHVAQALDGGLKRIQRTFGFDSGGALPTDQDGQAQEEGAARMASGEGAASQQEIEQVDDAIDPQRVLSDGDRHMIRLAKSTQWYLQQGRKEDAEASAEALILYGAKRFGQLGQLAGAAYRQYMQTYDPKHLQATINVLEKAYGLIPDGSKLDISINPDTQMLQVTKMDYDGKETTQDVSPEQLQQLIAGAQSGSIYWDQLMSLADPAGYRAKASEERQIRSGEATERRQAERDDRITKRQEKAAALAEDRRIAAATLEEERRGVRDQKLEESRLAAEGRRTEFTEKQATERHKLDLDKEERADKRYLRNLELTNPTMPWDEIHPLKDEIEQIREARVDNEDDPELKAAFNDKASRMFDLITKARVKDPVGWMEDLGITEEDYDYVAVDPATAAPAAEGAVPSDVAPPAKPAKYPNAKLGTGKKGEPIWFIMENGKAVQVG